MPADSCRIVRIHYRPVPDFRIKFTVSLYLGVNWVCRYYRLNDRRARKTAETSESGDGLLNIQRRPPVRPEIHAGRGRLSAKYLRQGNATVRRSIYPHELFPTS
ncbi:Hypothetical protein NTJ_13826 [Nesidiocoris tenuis]|uniref:Uncharacterized protein n=1 Tax=Nesidiocoris tenuis TaxID=355587 RepID=A0ABN7BBJ2_9HEMI|nr:Hypothetical protein NTJ_13826 [Nesidiocoris tenuis]